MTKDVEDDVDMGKKRTRFDGNAHDHPVRVQFVDDDADGVTLEDTTLEDVQAASPLLADMLSLGVVSIHTAAQNVENLRALVTNWPKVELRAYAETALEMPASRVRDLYRALDKYGFDSAIGAIHDRLKDRLRKGRMSMTDILRTFDCHPAVAMAMADVSDRWQRDVLERAEAERVARLADKGPDDAELASMIGELEPGQCVFMVFDGWRDDVGDGFADMFQSSALICRVPTKVRVDMIVPGGLTGLWLSYFCACLQRPDDRPAGGSFVKGVCVSPEETPVECVEYIVLTFPSPCGSCHGEMTMYPLNPDRWIDEAYSDIDEDKYKDEDSDEESYNEEARACPTLSDAIRFARLGRIEMVVKTVAKDAPVQVLHRTSRVDPDKVHLISA